MTAQATRIEAADLLYRADPILYRNLAVWIATMRRQRLTRTDIVEALTIYAQKFRTEAPQPNENWWPLLTGIARRVAAKRREQEAAASKEREQTEAPNAIQNLLNAFDRRGRMMEGR